MELRHFHELRACVFDWAGTVLDFGSLAPMGAFVELFARHDVKLTIAEAQGPMGLPKWQHIRALGDLPTVEAQWRVRYGRRLLDSDVDQLHEAFTPMSAAAAANRARLIPGAKETLAELKSAGLRIGSTTGYNRPILDILAPLARAGGFEPEVIIGAGFLPESRPSPMGMHHNLATFGILDPWRAVKVDDTVHGLEEGARAGAWTVAVLDSGNAVGMEEADWGALSEGARELHRQKARNTLSVARPDRWVRTIAELPGILREIDAAISLGARPNRS